MTEQRTGTLRLLTWALHAAVAVLLLIGVIRLLGGPSGGATERGGWQIALGCATAVLFALAYAWGSVPNRFTSPRAARWWLAGVTACWVLLMVFAAEFAWLAFPLFFLHLHLLRRWHAVVAVVVMTIMVIAAQGLHAGRLQVAMVLGPIVGAAFSVVGALAYEALYAESAARAASLAELRATRAELARSQREAGRLGEQERLAREIHDTLAQGLSSLVLLGRSARTELAAGTPEGRDRAAGLLAEIEQVAGDNLGEARRFVRELTPPDLGEGDLVAAIGRLVDREQASSQLRCELRVTGRPTVLPTPIATGLLRAAQASLANVRQHARAAHCVLTLGFLGDQVTLDVFDDGIGFDPERAASPESFGLPGMRGRIEQLGGRVEVESAPGAGTVIGIRVPLPTGHGSTS
ncbi:sensor histidine kinase [Enemella evansiae]|uniref:sensor histidine kinase n=1 Tax=Enemella evansiae TaxID=2016499 RepID=UPI000B977EF7|nr:sensor histidine kinase [Enemella evansiae]OYO01286.1 sensor histidine kinase [Enemella evansiae]